MNHSIHQHFFGYTLIDITKTGVTRDPDPESLRRNQQRNWETVLQCIGLRTQPLMIEGPQLIQWDMKSTKFGDFFDGTHNIWAWHWAVERTGIYDLPNDHLRGLKKDFEQVPVILGLEETARFLLPIFYPYGSLCNIYFHEVDYSVHN